MAKTVIKKKSVTKVKKEKPTASLSLETKILNQLGKETDSISLPAEIFGLPWNADLVHQVALAYASNARSPIAHAKGRGEVRGGGKKPWQQKGTGRSRHGSIRSPIWKGGGVTHGPSKDKNFDKKINKKMKIKALFTVLSKKLKDGEVFFVDTFVMKEPKTKEARNILSNLSKYQGLNTLLSKRKNSAAIFIPASNVNVSRSFSNFGNVVVDEIRNMNIMDILNVKNVLIASPHESIKNLETRIKN